MAWTRQLSKQSYSLSLSFQYFLFACKKSSPPGCPGLYLSLSHFISLPRDKLLKFWQILKSIHLRVGAHIHPRLVTRPRHTRWHLWHLMGAGSLNMMAEMAGPDQKRNCYCQTQSPPIWILIDQSPISLLKHQSKPEKKMGRYLLFFLSPTPLHLTPVSSPHTIKASSEHKCQFNLKDAPGLLEI